MNGLPFSIVSTLSSSTEASGARLIGVFPDLVSAIVLLVIGWLLISYITIGIHALFSRSSGDESLRRFSQSVISLFLRIGLIIYCAKLAGISASAIVTVIGAVTLGIGLALQGMLGNIAAGVIILVTKPFRVGDTIFAQGQEGTVNRIDVFHTILTTSDNQRVAIPNGKLSNDIIVNKTARDTRRIEIKLTLEKTVTIADARSSIEKVLKAHSKLISDKTPEILANGFSKDGVEIEVRAWAAVRDLRTVKSTLIEHIQAQLRTDGLYS